MTKPSFRKLRGYAFDPSFASTIDRRQTNEVIYRIKWEDTKPGPCGEYIDVIDYDPTKACFYEALDLQDSYVLADHGLPLSEGDPRFHQQQVYAVAMSVIGQFEKALGRKIIWSRLVENSAEGRHQYEHEYVPTLRIYPHALRQQNAYYSPAKMALLFGYFRSTAHWNGSNIPGTAIFTCLSPDIVAHEITHAILDSIHPYLRTGTNADMPAFHEGFADIIALLQRFTFTSFVEEQIQNSRGDFLSSQNFLGDLAVQFGQSVSSGRRALRSFLVDKDEQGNFRLVTPDPKKYQTETQPHKRGAILVAAVFDAFARLYRYKVADLIRLASNGSGILSQGEIDPDLVKRLSQEACEIAGKLMMVCIRALDYCPPVDLYFGDYLRALITSDVELNPDDEDGLRYALLEAFRSWGIIPANTNTWSVDSLMWKPIEEYFEDPGQAEDLRKAIHYMFDPGDENDYTTNGSTNPDHDAVTRSMEKILRTEDRESIFHESLKLSACVHDMLTSNFEGINTNLEQLLGMCFRQITYSITDELSGTEISLKAWPGKRFQVYKCRPVLQHNPRTGATSKMLIITFLQKVYVDLRNSPFSGEFANDRYLLRGGSTLIIDLATLDIRYAIIKRISSANRLKQQLDYAMNRLPASDSALLMQEEEPFAAIHTH
ncbi:hypothetical protein ACX0G7_17930 [Flavitalea antarctica]